MEQQQSLVHSTEPSGEAVQRAAVEGPVRSRDLIKIESQVLLGNSFTTYFVDHVTVDAEGRKSHGNLRATEDKHDARTFANEYAAARGVRVCDETYVAEVAAYHKSLGLIAEAKAAATPDCPLCHGAGYMFNAPCSAETCGYFGEAIAAAKGGAA